MVVDISREVYPFRFVLLGIPALILYPSYYYNYYFLFFILVFYPFYLMRPGPFPGHSGYQLLLLLFLPEYLVLVCIHVDPARGGEEKEGLNKKLTVEF